jgi:hypothetical protein
MSAIQKYPINERANWGTYGPRLGFDKTFISDHRVVFDICKHPEQIPIHGFLQAKSELVQDLRPYVVLSKTNLHSDILGMSVEGHYYKWQEPLWEEKTDDGLFWRGTTTGGWYSPKTNWKDQHRFRLVDFASPKSTHAHEKITVLPAPKSMNGDSLQRLSKEELLASVRDELDLGFTDRPIRKRLLGGRRLLQESY